MCKVIKPCKHRTYARSNQLLRIAHILLSKVLIDNGNQKTKSLALAPVSVLPDYQNRV